MLQSVDEFAFPKEHWVLISRFCLFLHMELSMINCKKTSKSSLEKRKPVGFLVKNLGLCSGRVNDLTL